MFRNEEQYILLNLYPFFTIFCSFPYCCCDVSVYIFFFSIFYLCSHKCSLGRCGHLCDVIM